VVESVYSAVWTDSLYKANYVLSLKGQTATSFSPQSLGHHQAIIIQESEYV